MPVILARTPMYAVAKSLPTSSDSLKASSPAVSDAAFLIASCVSDITSSNSAAFSIANCNSPANCCPNSLSFSTALNCEN